MSQDLFWKSTYGVGKAGAPLILGPTSLRAAIFDEMAAVASQKASLLDSNWFWMKLIGIEPLDEPIMEHIQRDQGGHLGVHVRHV